MSHSPDGASTLASVKLSYDVDYSGASRIPFWGYKFSYILAGHSLWYQQEKCRYAGRA